MSSCDAKQDGCPHASPFAFCQKNTEISSFSGFPGAPFLYTVRKSNATAAKHAAYHAENFVLDAERPPWCRVHRRNPGSAFFVRARRGHHHARRPGQRRRAQPPVRSAEHTAELQS